MNQTEIIADANGFLTVTYLKLRHPKLTDEEAKEYLEFCNKKTIRYKQCYSAQIMMPLWIESKSK